MKILLIGSGGREHALAWRLARSPRVEKVFVAPGNGGTAGGTAHSPKLENLPITDLHALADFAETTQIALTVVGPEAPLAAGVVDVFQSRGLKIFGPTQAAAQLESSKDFAKAFMARHGIPTARYQTFTDAARAHAYIAREGAPIVVKADGLAAGKGVVVAATTDEAHAAVDAMLDAGSSTPGARVVIEECLVGEEASFIVLCDGAKVLALATSQDHKRLLDGDQGPNTGGMGAYSPAPVVTPALHQRILDEIIVPTVRGMAADGVPYTGFLYAGVMIGSAAEAETDANPDATRPIHTLEFNCRMGDPETQPIMLRLASDLVTLIEHAVAGTLDKAETEWDPRPALGVVMAAANYPAAPRTGDLISGLPEDDSNCMVFHAGTRREGEQLLTSGGRVLCVTALGDTLAEARERAYATVAQIQFDGSQYRRDIGWRAL